ncbi:MAG: DEAD/DEAH box helicase family protein [Candidatus Parvarchaeum sp.]
MHARIDVYSHHFDVTSNVSYIQELLHTFSKRFLYISSLYNTRGEVVSRLVKVYAAANKDRTIIRYHINAYYDFIEFLKDRHVNFNNIEIVDHPILLSTPVNFTINSNYTPRDTQVPVIEYIIDKKHPRFKLLALDTGEGKTISTFFAMKELGLRTVVLLRPSYIDRWLDEINKVMINPKVMTVVGPDLKKLIKLAIDNKLDYDILLISNKTFQVFLKNYEELGDNIGDAGFDCTPDQFFSLIKADFRVIDEVHQDFHLNFKIDLYTHIYFSLSLSATLNNFNDTLDNLYSLAYPKSLRYHTVKPEKYRRMITVFYSIDSEYNIRDSNRGIRAYSHVVYENSILKYKRLRKDYLKMIYTLTQLYFLEKRSNEDKLIIFAGTIEMCENIVHYLKNRLPNISIEKYTGEDDYSNLIDPVIRVTTPASGGTAHDIPNLTTIIMTVAVDSMQINLQIFGRLRNLKGKELNYICLVNQDHTKHMSYHKKREKLLSGRCLSNRHETYPDVLGG